MIPKTGRTTSPTLAGMDFGIDKTLRPKRKDRALEPNDEVNFVG